MEITGTIEGRDGLDRSVQAHNLVAGPLEPGSIIEPLIIHAGLELMFAGPVNHRRKKVQEGLFSPAVLARVDVIVSAPSFGRNNVRLRSLRSCLVEDAMKCNPEFQVRSRTPCL